MEEQVITPDSSSNAALAVPVALNRWGAGALALGALAVLAVFATLHETAWAMVTTWYQSNSFNHCFLIIPISIYLAWRRRTDLALARIAPDWRGLLILMIASFAWLLGDVTGTLVVEELSIVVIVQGLVLTIYGKTIFRILAFPLAYLFFTVPFGLELIPPLQAVTAFLSVALLKLVGIPVFSDGYLISVPTGNWYVADACSGIRYVIASLALGALFAGTMYVTWWRRALVMVIAVIVPIIANGIRAFGIILIAYATNNELATGVDHLVYGWLFFTLVSCLILAIGMAFREAPPETAPRSVPPPRSVRHLLPSAVIGLLAVFLVGATRAYSDYVALTPNARALTLTLPEIAGYQLTEDNASDPLFPDFSGADTVVHAAYEGDGELVHLRIGYYRSERRGAQAISPNHELYGNPDTLIVGKGSLDARLGDQAASIRYQRISWGNRGRVIWYWYWIDGKLIGDPYLAKLIEAKVKLLGGQQAAAIIAIAVDYRSDRDAAEKTLRSFARQSGATLAQALAEAAR